MVNGDDSSPFIVGFKMNKAEHPPVRYPWKTAVSVAGGSKSAGYRAGR